MLCQARLLGGQQHNFTIRKLLPVEGPAIHLRRSCKAGTSRALRIEPQTRVVAIGSAKTMHRGSRKSLNPVDVYFQKLDALVSSGISTRGR